jgi:hypothetical protein
MQHAVAKDFTIIVAIIGFALMFTAPKEVSEFPQTTTGS